MYANYHNLNNKIPPGNRVSAQNISEYTALAH